MDIDTLVAALVAAANTDAISNSSNAGSAPVNPPVPAQALFLYRLLG